MTKPKFDVGDIVKFVRDTDQEAGEVVSLSFVDGTWRYVISSKEVDLFEKKVINGVKTCLEDELVAVKGEKDEK